MKHTSILGLVLAASMLMVGTANAATNIAVISAGKLVTSSPQYKSAEEAMRKEFESRADELKDSVAKLSADIEKFKRDADIMSGTDRAQKEKDLNTRRIDQGYAERKFKEDFASRRQELFNEALEDITKVIKAVAKEGKYDLVVQDPVYAVDSIDITETVLKRLKKGK